MKGLIGKFDNISISPYIRLIRLKSNQFGIQKCPVLMSFPALMSRYSVNIKVIRNWKYHDVLYPIKIYEV